LKRSIQSSSIRLSAGIAGLLLVGACSRGPRVHVEVLQEGDGAVVQAGDYITAHYTLDLADGTRVQSSRPEEGGRGPFQTTIGAGFAIQGWDRAIPGMKVGERSRLTIPPELGYGENERPGIPAGSTLVFDIEVLEAQHSPVTLPDGISYEILEEGDGEVVRRGDEISAHYTVFLPDGKMVQSSRPDLGGRGPFDTRVGVGRLIDGWDSAIPGMRVGERRKLFVPSALAYGEAGQGQDIPPDTDLTFEVEILSTRTPSGQ
jgi:FK506-binding protein 9/10